MKNLTFDASTIKSCGRVIAWRHDGTSDFLWNQLTSQIKCDPVHFDDPTPRHDVWENLKRITDPEEEQK